MAGRKCTICEHKKRKEIDKECVRDGAILRTIANHFALSESALKRHVKGGHIIAKIAKAVKAQEIAQADDLLQEVKDLELKTNQIIDSALPKKEGMEQKPYLALKAIDTRHKQIELKGKILGAFKKDDSPKETGIVIVKTLKGVSMDDL